MLLEFTGEIIYWRGPSPWHFVAVPDPHADEIHDVARDITYGWGCIPATVTLGGSEFTTSLFPKDEGYLVPIKASVRRAEHLDIGDEVDLTVGIREPFGR